MSFLVRRRWWVIAPFIALSCLLAILIKELPKVYVSKSVVLVKPREVPENFVMDLTSASSTWKGEAGPTSKHFTTVCRPKRKAKFRARFGH